METNYFKTEQFISMEKKQTELKNEHDELVDEYKKYQLLHYNERNLKEARIDIVKARMREHSQLMMIDMNLNNFDK